MDPAPSATVAAGQSIVLERELIARDVAALKRRLDPYLAVAGPLEIDASSVERVDACGVQLLLAFVRARREYGSACSVTRPSAAFERALATLGLQSQLGAAASHDSSNPS